MLTLRFANQVFDDFPLPNFSLELIKFVIRIRDLELDHPKGLILGRNQCIWLLRIRDFCKLLVSFMILGFDSWKKKALASWRLYFMTIALNSLDKKDLIASIL